MKIAAEIIYKPNAVPVTQTTVPALTDILYKTKLHLKHTGQS